MIQKINTQISAINDSLAQIKKNKPEHYEQRFMQLVEERRKLRKLAQAESQNPAIAAFGESQKGKKSYQQLKEIIQKGEQSADKKKEAKRERDRANSKRYYERHRDEILAKRRAKRAAARLS